jgi:chemotaxis protein methyltransferase CheR
VKLVITITDKEFFALADYIKHNYGIHLKKEKQALVTGRLHNVLLENNFKSFSEYFNYIVSDKSGEAAATLVNKITTNHTFFMREEEHFDYLQNVVLPYLTQSVTDKDLRIWSAGCSSGEEPYTIAMILDDYFGRDKIWWDTKVLATDISSNVLEEARKGQYSNEDIAHLPPQWRQKYFNCILSGSDSKECAELCQKIRNEVIFRKFNLMESVFPFKRKFHVIFCRNVMIYFDNETKKRLVDKLYDLTEDGGFLFIGHSESLNREQTRYKYIMPALYRKE